MAVLLSASMGNAHERSVRLAAHGTMPAAGKASSAGEWVLRIYSRVRVFWPAKMLGTMLGIAVFFAAYFWILATPLSPVTLMPLTALDRIVEFRPEMLPLYVSLWFYISFAPALIVDRRELISYGLATLALSIIGLGIFLVWPTAVPRPDVDWSQHHAFSFLKSIDATGNACPSMHVAFAVFTAIWFERLLRQIGAAKIARWISWMWCLGILYSTLAIRQHVLLDVVAGAALGAIVAWFHLRWLNVSHTNFPSR